MDFFIQNLVIIFAFQFHSFMSTLTQSIPIKNVEQLREELQKGPVRFSFVKKSQEALRNAVGTTNLANIPTDKHPNGRGRKAIKSVPFFDLMENSWKSVSISSLVFG